MRISADRHQLEDRDGKPFLYVGDAAWLLFYKPTLEEVNRYIDDRCRRGFTALQVQLLTYKRDLYTGEGIKPLEEAEDISRFNPEFLRRCDAIIEIAAKHGMLVSIAPIWQGFGDSGWWKTIRDGGVAQGTRFGKLVGEHFARHPNILWIIGGDADPGPCRDFLRAMAEGIKETAPQHLLTAHAGSPLSAADAWPDEKWLDVNATYDYAPNITDVGRPQYHVYAATRHDYERKVTRPFFLIESAYENERHSSSQWLRRQAYWSILGGSFGVCFGNLPVYNFDRGWVEALNSQGARDMQHVAELFGNRPWRALVPDWKHEVLVDGYGTYFDSRAKDPNHHVGYDYATAAFNTDVRLIVVYVPSPRKVKINLNRFAGPLTARWFDPTSGTWLGPAIYPSDKNQPADFDAPVKNSAGDGDSVLLLEAR